MFRASRAFNSLSAKKFSEVVKMSKFILRMKDVVEIVGVSENTIRNWINQEIFPKPIKLGPRAVGWRSEQIEDWLHERARLEEDYELEGML